MQLVEWISKKKLRTHHLDIREKRSSTHELVIKKTSDSGNEANSNQFPLVSVVIPAYNSESFVEVAVNSIRAQTYNNLEIIVIDDQSTDSTPLIVKSLTKIDDRVFLIKNIGHKGVAGALNFGIRNAHGNFIARMDSDDIARPTRIEKQVEFLIKNPNYQVVGTGYAPFDEKGHILDIIHPANPLLLAWNHLFDSFFCHPSVMFRKSIFFEIGGYPLVPAEDYVFFSKITLSYPCSNLKEVLIDYRSHPNKVSNTHKNDLQESNIKHSKKIFKIIFGDLEKYEDLRNLTLRNEKVNISIYKLILYFYRFVGILKIRYKHWIAPGLLINFYFIMIFRIIKIQLIPKCILNFFKNFKFFQFINFFFNKKLILITSIQILVGSMGNLCR